MREMREIISHYWGKEIQLETPEGHLDYLRSSLGSQFSKKKHLTTIFNHKLPAKILLGPPIVG